MKKIAKEIIIYLIISILAGIMIGISKTVFLSLDNKIIEAIFFAVGLFIIVTKNWLYF